MMGNVRTKELSTEVFLKLLQLSKSCIGRGMRPAQVVPFLREVLVQGGTSRAETRLLARTDVELYTWFRLAFLTEKSRAGVQKLGDKLDEVRKERMAAALSVVSLLVDHGLVLGQTGLPEEQEHRSVEAEPEVEHVYKKRRVAQLDVVEPSERDVENWQPSGLGLGATSPNGTLKKKLNGEKRLNEDNLKK